MPQFEIIEHTADVGIRAFGPDEKTVFQNTAYGMFCLITDLDQVNEETAYPIEVESEDRQTLLVEWLNELLYLYDSHDVLLKRFEIDELSDTRLKAVAWGEPINRARHELVTDIKAATYYMLDVRQIDGGWQSEVIFDV